jgi:hypothetical protein
MKRGTICCIAGGVIAAHALLFWWIKDEPVLPKRTYIPPPNFIAKEGTMVDAETGEKIILREYTVSTKLEEPFAQDPGR